jgi:hypothetical protein
VKSHDRVIELLSTALLIIVGIMGMFISILDFIGTDFTSGLWVWLKGPLPAILLTVAILALALGLERLVRFQRIDRKLNTIEYLVERGPERIIHSLGGVDVKRFDDSQGLFEYVTKRMREAKKTIDDVTWGLARSEQSPASHKAFEKYLETITAVCSKNKVAYREVMSFPPHYHLPRAESILAKNLPGYKLNYYLLTEVLPLLEFMVVDSEEVILSFYRFPFLPAEREIRLAVKHPALVNWNLDKLN